MKICKLVIGALAVVVSVVTGALYFVTKADPSSALAVATYYPADVTGTDSTVYVALVIALVAMLAGGLLSIIFANSRKYEVVMIACFAVGFLVSLMYSLMIPALLYVAIVGFISLMFSVSYSQVENDLGGKL